MDFPQVFMIPKSRMHQNNFRLWWETQLCLSEYQSASSQGYQETSLVDQLLATEFPQLPSHKSNTDNFQMQNVEQDSTRTRQVILSSKIILKVAKKMFGNWFWNQKKLYIKGLHVIPKKEMDCMSLLKPFHYKQAIQLNSKIEFEIIFSICTAVQCLREEGTNAAISATPSLTWAVQQWSLVPVPGVSPKVTYWQVQGTCFKINKGYPKWVSAFFHSTAASNS